MGIINAAVTVVNADGCNGCLVGFVCINNSGAATMPAGCKTVDTNADKGKSTNFLTPVCITPTNFVVEKSKQTKKRVKQFEKSKKENKKLL